MSFFRRLSCWVVTLTCSFVLFLSAAALAENGPLLSVLDCQKSEKRNICLEAEQTVLDIVGERGLSEEQVARILLKAAAKTALGRETTHDIACLSLELIIVEEELKPATIEVLRKHAFETDHGRYEDCSIKLLHSSGWRSKNDAHNLLMDSVVSKGTAGNEFDNSTLLGLVDQITNTERFQDYNIYTLGLLRRRLAVDEMPEFCNKFLSGSKKGYNDQHVAYVSQTLARTYTHDSGCFEAIIDALSLGENRTLFWVLLSDNSGGQERLLSAIMSGLKKNSRPKSVVRQIRAQLDNIWIEGADVPWTNDFSMLKDRAEHSSKNEEDAYVDQVLSQFPQGRARKFVSLMIRTAQKDAYKTDFLTDSGLKHIVEEGQLQTIVDDAFIDLGKIDFEFLASFPEDEQLLAIQILAAAGGGWSNASGRHSYILSALRMKRIVELSDAALLLYQEGHIDIPEEILVHYPWNKGHFIDEDWSPDTFVVGKPDR